MSAIYDHVVFERHLNPSIHRVWIDEDERIAAFPLLDLSYRMVGYQIYRPDADKKRMNDPREGRYYTYRNKDTISLWGLESWHFSNALFVTEGIFDAARLTALGYSAVAIASNDPSKETRKYFRMIRNFRPVIVVSDDDENGSGRKLEKLGHFSLHVKGAKDLGDATDDQVFEMLERARETLNEKSVRNVL